MELPALQSHLEEQVLNLAGFVRLLRDDHARADALLQVMQAHLVEVRDLDRRSQERLEAVGKQLEEQLHQVIPQAVEAHVAPLQQQVEQATRAVRQVAGRLEHVAHWLPTKVMVWIAVGLFVMVGLASGFWVRHWKTKHDALVPHVRLAAGLHAYLDTTLYGQLTAKRQGEIAQIYKQLGLRPPASKPGSAQR